MDGGRVSQYGIVHPLRLADYARLEKRRLLLAALALAPCAALAQPAGDPGSSWVSSCAGGTGCTLRYREPLFSKSGISADLEIRSASGAKVPVVIIHGLPKEPILASVVSSQIDATLSLDQGASGRLSCSSAGDVYACQPDGGVRGAFDAALPQAKGLTISVSASLPGMDPISLGNRHIPLSGTQQALSQAKGLAEVPAAAGASPSVQSGWMGAVDKALRAMGFQNGTGGIGAMIARLMR